MTAIPKRTAATSLDGKHKRRFEEEQMRSLGVKVYVLVHDYIVLS